MKQSSPIKARLLIAKLLAWQPVFPNVNFLKDSGIELGKGIKVNRFLETSKIFMPLGTVSNMKPLIYVDQ
jgi:hypothetical protein